ncbi:MAG TPA: response regulator transcription factor [Armatimonadota bacterium]|nr:response regulator transcription factor [Armatimonadota bacterium]
MRDKALLMMRPGRTRDRVAARLCQQNVRITVADEFVAGLQLLLADRPDVALLDLTISGVDGPDACARVGRRANVGLIAVADEDGCPPAAEVLDCGAADYVARPLSPAELVARIRALLRRIKEYSLAAALSLQCGDLAIDGGRHEVTIAGEPLDLTPKEFDLLMALASRPGQLISREDLLRDVWGLREGINTRTLDVHIGRLRRKLGRTPGVGAANAPGLIVTVPRVGYKLAA